MKARHKAAKGTRYSYDDTYEDDYFMDSYDDSYTASQEAHLIGPGQTTSSFNIDEALPEDDNDLLNDCFDQIDAFFNGQMEYDEDFIVEFLRSNDYNVEEAIDCILENGYSKIPKEEVQVPKVDKPVALPATSSYTLPTNTLASVIGKEVPAVQKTAPIPNKTYTIESDILNNHSHFTFDTLSPDDKAHKLQEEGKLRVKEHQSTNPFSIEFPKEAESLHSQPLTPRTPPSTSKETQSKPITPQSPLKSPPKSPMKSPLKSPRSPVERVNLMNESVEPEVVLSPPALVEGKETVTVIVAGHVDHGKSTITGHLMVLLNMVNDREFRRVTKEAKELGKQSFNYAFLLDQNPEEREHGVTINLGMMSVQTEHRCITLLDAPGHRDFVSAMISGGLRADAGMLVVSAQKGEFEAGWSSLGISKEHLLIMAGSGIETVAIVINKMDTCGYGKDRYDEIMNAMIPYLKKLGFKRKNVLFIPVSGLEGINLVKHNKEKMPWYEGPSLIDFMNNVQRTQYDASVMNTRDVVMSVTDIFRGDQQGDCIGAHLARGFIDMSDIKPLMLLPGKLPFSVKSLLVNNHKANVATAGNNVILITTGLDFSSVNRGSIITTVACPLKPSNRVVAQLYVNQENDMPVMKGLTVVLHLDGVMVSAVVQHVLAQVDYSGKVLKAKPKVVYGGQWASVELALDREVYIADWKTIPAMSRFIMQDNGKTMGIGKVTEVRKSKFHKM